MKYQFTTKDSLTPVFVALLYCCFYILISSAIGNWLFDASIVGAIFGLGMLIMHLFFALFFDITERLENLIEHNSQLNVISDRDE